jgi:hypothetical protein
MGETGKSILLSKTVWTAAAGVVIAALNVAGVHVADAHVDQLIDLGLFALTGIFRYTATQPVYIAPPK